MSGSSTRTRQVRRALRTPAVLAWLRLMRVHHKVSRTTTEALRAAGLTLGQFTVLAHVGAAPGMAQQELAARLAVTEGNVCQLIGKMERNGLLERRQEKRTNRLSLTAEGQTLYERVVPANELRVAEQFAGLSRAQQADLHRLLRDLDRSLGSRRDGLAGGDPDEGDTGDPLDMRV